MKANMRFGFQRIPLFSNKTGLPIIVIIENIRTLGAPFGQMCSACPQSRRENGTHTNFLKSHNWYCQRIVEMEYDTTFLIKMNINHFI